VILGLCTGNNFEKYLGTLSTLNFKQARVFFASKKLRDSLDGALAEEFDEKSLQAESDLKKAQK
jgi:hypothetical protein